MAINFTLYPKQQRALLSPAQEILYGGAAGGGKSYLMRVISILLALEVPNLKVFLFRRLYKELYLNHVYSADGYLATLKPLIDAQDVVFNKSDGVFTFYNGSQIYLCHCQHEGDEMTYLGAEMHLLLIDEAAQFTEKMLRFLRTRVRLGTLPVQDKWKKVLPKILYCTNPGGVSHNYFRKGFVNHGAGKIFTAPPLDGGMTREYIPALYTDNLLLVKNDPSYDNRIRGIGDPKLVEAYLKGSWDIGEDSAFGDVWDPDIHIIDSIRVPGRWGIDRSHDYGYSAPAATLYCTEADGSEVIVNDAHMTIPKRSVIILSEIYFADKEGKGVKYLPRELALRMKEHEKALGWWGRVLPGPADSSIFDKDRGHLSIHEMYNQSGIYFTKADKRPGSRSRGFLEIRQRLVNRRMQSRDAPWLLIHRSCANLIAQLPELPLSKNNPEDVDTEADDHIYDTVRYRVLRATHKADQQSFAGY